MLNTTRAAFGGAIDSLLSSGQFDNSTASFSIQVFSVHSDDPIFEYYYTAAPSGNGSLGGGGRTVGPGTLYRIGSISKLVSVYAILSKLGDRYWAEPITKYVPELAAADQRQTNTVDNVRWSEVTLGALASHSSGVGRDCKSDLFSCFTHFPLCLSSSRAAPEPRWTGVMHGNGY